MSNAVDKKRSPVFFGIVFAVIMLVVYYIFAYIPNKESELEQRGIRVMNRMVQNIAKKEAHYKKSFSAFRWEYIYANAAAGKLSKEDSANQSISSCIYTSKRLSAANPDKRVKVSTEEQENFLVSSEIEGVYFGISPQDFLDEIKHYTFFDDILLSEIESGEVLDSSLNNIHSFKYAQGNQIGKTKYDASGKIKEPLPVDSKKTISGVALSEQEISNTDYFCYTTLVMIDEQPYHLTGLISQKHYQSQVRQVSIWVVIITFVFLVFLIQILPIAKPFLLSKKDRLKSSDVMWSGVSLIFGLSALVLFALSIDTFILEEKDLVDKKLEAYSQALIDDFEKDRIVAYSILSAYAKDQLIDGSKVSNLSLANSIFNTQKDHFSILAFDSDGKLNSYLKIFKNGEVEDSESRPDLSHRMYVQIHADQEQAFKAWAPPTDVKEGDRFPTYVESVFSLATGEYESVISIKKGDKIYALVYPLQSVNNVYLEPNYQFAVIDRKGNIHYHSDQSKIHNENILDESNNNKNLSAFLQNGSSTLLDLNVSLVDYSGHLSPINKTSYYLLTLYDIKKSRLTISTSMATTFLFTLCLLGYLLFFHLILKLQRFLSSNQGHKAVTYYFINPSGTHREIYFLLGAANVLVGLFFFSLYKTFYLNIMDSVVLFFATISVLMLLNYSELSRENKHTLQPDYPIKKIPFSLFELVLFAASMTWILIHLATKTIATWQVLVPMAMLVFVFYRKWKWKSKRQSFSKRKEASSYRPFYFHAFSWVVLLSVFPVLVFFKPIYNQQHIKRVTHNLQEEYFTRIKSQNWESKKYVDESLSGADYIIPTDSNSRKMLDALTISFDPEERLLKGLHKSENLKVEIK
ncbi:MAG: hypothetical protein N4A46_00620, partial [Schleiferiaceae bacterium]|nr:hypothetical protein [Schleiferiaceae bacterium]